MMTTSVDLCFLFLVTVALLGNDVVMSAKWRQARDVFLSNMESLSEKMKREPHRLITTRDLFGMTENEDVKLTDSAQSIQGTDIKKYKETYEGLPVFDATLTVETDAVTDLYTGQVTGKLVQNLDKDIESTKPNVTEDEAVKLAVMYGNFTTEGVHIESEKPLLEIYVKDQKGFLVYRVRYFAVTDKRNYRFCMMIDAKTGDLLEKWNALENKLVPHKIEGIGGNKLMGKHVYGEDMPYLNVEQSGEDCYFLNDIVKVFNMKGKTNLNADEQKIYHANCKKGSQDKINNAYSPINDALFYGSVVYNMYKEWLNVSPVKELPMIFEVHYGRDFANAFYSGQVFTFGDGNKDEMPFVVLDMVAHEVSHCFTEENSGLIYEAQSGAINEAYSDLAGAAVEYFEFEENSWEFGEDISSKPIRKMCNQSDDGSSIIHTSKYSDDLDVHESSGIFNRFFCLLSKSEGWNVQKTFQIVALANRFYWHPKTGFKEGACDIIKAAYDLGYDLKAVKKSFNKVGIKACDISIYVRSVHQNSTVEKLKSVEGEEVIFKLTVKKTPWKKVNVLTFSGEGDVDLYVCFRKVNCKEHLTKWRSNKPGTDQQVTMTNPKSGEYFIKLKPQTRSYFSEVTMKITFEG